jgi:hypothetical protein
MHLLIHYKSIEEIKKKIKNKKKILIYLNSNWSILSKYSNPTHLAKKFIADYADL